MTAWENLGYTLGVLAGVVGGCLRLWRVQDRRAASRRLAAMRRQHQVVRMLGRAQVTRAALIPAQRTGGERRG